MRPTMLFLHFIGLALGTGSGFASLFLGISNKNLPKEELKPFMLKLRALGYMGLSGLILLVLSGGYLASPYWSNIGSMPFFIVKLSLVLALLILVVMMDVKWRKAIRNHGGPDLQAIPKLGRLAFPISLLIILFAVLQFR
jgi:hypothetical protein